MDVLIPPEDSYYEDYYNAEGLEEYRPCEKTHIQEFSNAFLPIFYTITCVLSIIANITLLIIFIKYKTPRKMFPLNMVISDILFTLTLPFWAVYADSEWIFGDFSCKAITFVYMVCLYSSNLFVASHSLQRFLGIVCTASSVRIFSNPKMNAILCCLVWLLSGLATIVHVTFVEAQEFQQHKICTYHFHDKMGWKMYIQFQMNILGFILPFLVLLFCSIRLPRVALRRTTFQRFLPMRNESGFTVMFFLLWFPYSVVIFLHVLQNFHILYACTSNMHLDFAVHVTECLAFTHVFINPLLYIFLNKKIWKRLRNACKTPREYLLEESNNSSNMSVQDDTIELMSVQRYQGRDLSSFCAERPGTFLPEAT
ncbi:C-C chemokine receptor type 1 [Myxocyprinus asiaticus]|uniref:C-C chemokine receptor type 1 n=1 Tax=Myxocyprinus asiaticus TaxID=70543 RepID=UPI002221DA29|nr:C-C chemokine receptor type 1 [Myxocyprinus asiaticus]